MNRHGGPRGKTIETLILDDIDRIKKPSFIEYDWTIDGEHFTFVASSVLGAMLCYCRLKRSEFSVGVPRIVNIRAKSGTWKGKSHDYECTLLENQAFRILRR